MPRQQPSVWFSEGVHSESSKAGPAKIRYFKTQDEIVRSGGIKLGATASHTDNFISIYYGNFMKKTLILTSTAVLAIAGLYALAQAQTGESQKKATG